MKLKNIFKFFKYFLENIIIYIFFFVGKIIGLSLARKLFVKIFIILGPFVKSKEIIKNNLRLINGNIENLKIIEKKMWENYGKTFIEYIYLKKLKEKKMNIQIKNQNILDNIKKNKKPVIFVSGHFGNFEMMSMELTKQNINLATIYRPLNNYFLNFFMEYLRKKFICKNQIKKGRSGIKEAIEYLNKNYSVALMIDQRVSEGKSLPFFQKEALTTTLPAQLAIKYNCEIIPIYLERKASDTFLIEIYEPIQTKGFENTDEDKSSITLKLNKILEEMVLRDPSQWILTHNRWK